MHPKYGTLHAVYAYRVEYKQSSAQTQDVQKRQITHVTYNVITCFGAKSVSKFDQTGQKSFQKKN